MSDLHVKGKWTKQTIIVLKGRTLIYKLYCICLIPWGLCRVPRGEILEQKTDEYIGEVWYTIARNQMTYNTTGKRITSEKLAGQVATTAWNQYVCNPVDELISGAKLGGPGSRAVMFLICGTLASTSRSACGTVSSGCRDR